MQWKSIFWTFNKRFHVTSRETFRKRIFRGVEKKFPLRTRYIRNFKFLSPQIIGNSGAISPLPNNWKIRGQGPQPNLNWASMAGRGGQIIYFVKLPTTWTLSKVQNTRYIWIFLWWGGLRCLFSFAKSNRLRKFREIFEQKGIIIQTVDFRVRLNLFPNIPPESCTF